MKRLSIIASLLLLSGMACLPVLASEAPVASGNMQPAAPAVLKLNRNLSPTALQGKAATDLVELSNGKRMKIGDIRRLTAVAQKNRSLAPNSKEPPALKLRPAATGGIALRNKNDFQAVMQRPDNETVVLPSGKRTTVGMLKLVQPQVEERRKQLRPAAISSPRPDLAGPAIRVDATTDWYALFKQPDTTVLETSHGKRITLGELKQTLAASDKQSLAAPHIR